MNLYQTKLVRKAAGLPTNCDFQTILKSRKKVMTKDDTYTFYRARAGAVGEQTLVDYLKKYGEQHWIIIQNLWLDYYGTYESDLILITRANCYVFEVKNFEGVFTYENGVCSINQQKIGNNCVSQTLRAHSNLQNICREAQLGCNPEGVLVLIGEHNWVDIKTKVDDVHILMRNQLPHYIKKIAEEEENNTKKLDPKRLFQLFETYEIMNPFLPESISESEMATLHKGIYCRHCESYKITMTYNYIKCDCGFHEPRDEGIIRTICEYGVLNYKNNLLRRDLLYFLDHQISHTNLQDILRKYFKIINKTRYTYYHNKKLPYYKIEDEFDIPLCKKHYLKNKKLQIYY